MTEQETIKILSEIDEQCCDADSIFNTLDWQRRSEALCMAIKALEQQPQDGEWIEEEKILWKCSKCGLVIFAQNEHDRKEFHAYCGRCGARMNGGADEQKSHT